MLNLKYANINAKLKGMKAKKLNEDDIINILRQNDLKNAIFFLKSKTNELNELSENSTMEQVGEYLNNVLKNDAYKLKRLVSNKEKEFIELFIKKYEIKDDEYNDFIKKLYKKAEKISKDVTNIIIEKIDLLNILYIYRLKKYYNISKEDIDNYLIDIKGSINLEKLIESNNIEDLKNALEQTKYRNFAKELNENNMEKAVNKYLYIKYKKELLKSKYNLSTIILYLYLIEYQLKDIKAILEGIYDNIPKEEILKNIILGDEIKIGDREDETT